MSDGPATEPQKSLARRFRELYCAIDPRTLGFFRIVHGTLMAADLVRHWTHARRYYSNDGVLTNHFHLFRPSGSYNFSIFHAFSTLNEVHVAFACALMVHLLYLVGYKTRLFAVLSFIVVTSMDNRLVMVENGGYVVVNLLAGWAMFMPTGSRFSIDALLRSFRDGREVTLADLREPLRRETQPFNSLVVAVATINVAVIYLLNAVSKNGPIWRRGEAVHYVLHLDRMVTGLAVFFREHLPQFAYRPLAWSVLAVESLLWIWILYPKGRRITRTCAILSMWALHATFGVMMRLGPFSWFMIGWSFLLVVPEHWEALGAFHARRFSSAVVRLDPKSPLAFALARVLRRFDVLSRLRFEAGEPSGPLLEVRPDGAPSGPLTGRAALAAIARRFPLGFVLYPVLEVATLFAIPAAYFFFERRREAVARFFGLRASLDSPEPEPPSTDDASRTLAGSPIGAAARRRLSGAREVVVAYLGVCAVLQAYNENKQIPKTVEWRGMTIPLKIPLPEFVVATIYYPRMSQGWGMFAPNPIQEDGMMVVDAITKGGRRIDPFTGMEPDLDLTDSRGLGLSQIAQDYANRIRLDHNKPFRQPLRDYLLRYHLETGNPDDELVSFDVYWLKDQCPKFGESQPTGNELIPLLTYRRPRWVPPPGHPKPRPEPEVRSAGK